MNLKAALLGGYEVPDLTHDVAQEGRGFVAMSGLADVYRGTWRMAGSQCSVAIKVLRHYANESEGLHKRKSRKINRLLRVWCRLEHDNVLPFYGTVANFGVYPSMVCPWAANRDLTSYLASRHEELTRAYRFRMLSEIAAGLKYLHERSVVHGDLTGSNVLIDENECCLLCDIGLSTVLEEFHWTSYFLGSSVPQSVQWAAPELLTTAHGGSTSMLDKRSDVFSFGRLVHQIFSGKIPFNHIRLNSAVIIELYRGRSPERPQGVADAQWRMVTACWSVSPGARPDTKTCLVAMQDALTDALMKAEPEMYTDYRSSNTTTDPGDDGNLHVPRGNNSRATVATVHGGRSQATSEHLFHDRSTSKKSPSPDLHSFAELTCVEAARCRVCLKTSTQTAVICSNCGFIAHWKCAAEGLLDRVPLCVQSQRRLDA